MFCTTRCSSCSGCICKKNKEVCFSLCKCDKTICTNNTKQLKEYSPENWSFTPIEFFYLILIKSWGLKKCFDSSKLTPWEVFELFWPNELMEHIFENSNIKTKKLNLDSFLEINDL